MSHRAHRRTARRAGLAAGAGLCVTALLAGCGLGTAGGFSPTGELTGEMAEVDLDGVTLNIGSKDFTEQTILGKMVVILAQSAGADVNDLTNIPGTNSVREAILQDELDFYWEYTGTAWLTYLGFDDPIIDAYEQYEAVRDEDAANGLVWLEPSELDNTYGMATTREFADSSGVTALSDIADLDEADQSFCMNAEFAARNDGFYPMLEHYGIDEPSSDRESLIDTGAVYQATADGVCTFGAIFATDGRIPALDLVVLEDDEDYFPRYNLSGVVREEIIQDHPQFQELLDPLAERLDNDTMSQLNQRVDVDGDDPADVAWDFLTAEGYVE